MVALINDPWLEKRIIDERQRRGIDQHDEVWDGTYVIYSPKDNEHQELKGGLTSALLIALEWGALGDVRPGVNVSDRKVDWNHNYRCPDVAVFLNDTKAENCDTYWYGGPDLAVEITSPGDRSRDKLDFYGKVGTRELLIVDREPWLLDLYRLQGEQLVLVGRSTTEDSRLLSSEVVPLSWKLISGEQRPQIEIVHHDGQQRWVI